MGKIFFATLCIILLQLPVNAAQIFYDIAGHPINSAAMPHTRYKMVKYDVTGKPAYTGNHSPININRVSNHIIKYDITGMPINQIGMQRSQIGVNANSSINSNYETAVSNITRPDNIRDRRIGAKIPQRMASNCRGLVQYRNGKPLCGN